MDFSLRQLNVIFLIKAKSKYILVVSQVKIINF